MQRFNNPPTSDWARLAQRPQLNQNELENNVREIMEYVAQKGDLGVQHFTRLIDGVTLESPRVSAEQLAVVAEAIPRELKAAIELARTNIETFHRAQCAEFPVVETTEGVRCWSRQVAIERVGLYIPGGSAPLFSSLLMLAIPAQLAGCQNIVVCSPPNREGHIAPSILYVAELLGIKNVFAVGGAQAIAAMTFGTETIPRVDKLFGPGNQYVTKAKELAQRYGIAIDMPAGPSEVLVIADEESNATFVAADLLSQAEHGPDSQVMLVSSSETLVENCLQALEDQLSRLPRADIARKALSNSKTIVLPSLNDAIAFSNAYAPEHLIIATQQPETLASKVINAGSVFLGAYSCESAGDYASGTNHTLPTNGFARSYSGVSVRSFCKQITFQQLSAEGLQNIGSAVELMAAAEGLEAHKNAVSIRLKSLCND